MPLKILINGVTLDPANITPLLINIKYWQNHNCQITIVGNRLLKKNIIDKKIIKSFGYINLDENSKIDSKLKFIFIGIKRNLKLIKNIKNFINKYSIVHSRSSVLDLIIFPYFLKSFDKKIKWTTVFDNVVPFTDPGNKFIRLLAWLFFLITVLLIKKADIIFVVNPDLKSFLIKHGFDSNKIFLTGNAVHNKYITAAKYNKDNSYDAIFLGRINETKGIYDMLKVLKIITNTIPQFKLALIGPGDKTSIKQFKEKIKEDRLTKNVKLLGWVSEKEKYSILKSSKIFIFLSKSKCESFGIALLEAVCSGKPTFVYNLPIYKYIYKNNEINIFKIGDIDSVAASILNVFKKKQFENKNGKKLLGKYTWEAIAKIEYEIFKKLLKNETS